MKTIIKKPIFDIFSKKENSKETKEENLEIVIDYREKNSLVPIQLKKLGFKIELRELKVADYIVKDTAIERKTISDFLSSMVNKRLLRQLEEIQQYPNRLLIIEGIEHEDLYPENSKINPNAIRGFLLSIVLKYRVPIIFTKNSEDTAKFIYVLAKKQTKEASLNVSKKQLTPKEQKQFIIEGFPGIGPKTAKKLLEKFENIKNITNASIEQLEEVLGKKAKLFCQIIKDSY